LKELGAKFPGPLEPFGTYVEAVQRGNLLVIKRRRTNNENTDGADIP